MATFPPGSPTRNEEKGMIQGLNEHLRELLSKYRVSTFEFGKKIKEFKAQRDINDAMTQIAEQYLREIQNKTQDNRTRRDEQLEEIRKLEQRIKEARSSTPNGRDYNSAGLEEELFRLQRDITANLLRKLQLEATIKRSTGEHDLLNQELQKRRGIEAQLEAQLRALDETIDTLTKQVNSTNDKIKKALETLHKYHEADRVEFLEKSVNDLVKAKEIYYRELLEREAHQRGLIDSEREKELQPSPKLELPGLRKHLEDLRHQKAEIAARNQRIRRTIAEEENNLQGRLREREAERANEAKLRNEHAKSDALLKKARNKAKEQRDRLKRLEDEISEADQEFREGERNARNTLLGLQQEINRATQARNAYKAAIKNHQSLKPEIDHYAQILRDAEKNLDRQPVITKGFTFSGANQSPPNPKFVGGKTPGRSARTPHHPKTPAAPAESDEPAAPPRSVKRKAEFSGVVISQVDPTQPCITLKNSSGEEVDISGWQIKNKAWQCHHMVKDVIMQPNSEFRFLAKHGATSSKLPTNAQYLSGAVGSSDVTWANTQVILLDRNGKRAYELDT